MSVVGQLKWWAWKEEWGRKQGTKEAEIITVEIFNQDSRQTDKIKCGDTVTLRSEFVVHEEIKGPHFGVAIFREDGIYCYGPNTLFDGYIIEKLKKGKGWFSIEYKSLNLAPGMYRFSVAIWDKKEILAYDYHPGLYRFEIIGSRGTGELLCLSHRWKPNNPESSIGLLHFTKGLSLDSLEGKWNKKDIIRRVEIDAVRFLDEKGKARDCFRSNEQAEIKIKLKTNQEKEELYLWVGIFRKDKVYCYGAFKKLTKGEKEISLIYPKLQLLPGEYRVSIGIWDSPKATPLVCDHGMYPFIVGFDKEEHGTVYLEHKWNWELP